MSQSIILFQKWLRLKYPKTEPITTDPGTRPVLRDAASELQTLARALHALID